MNRPRPPDREIETAAGLGTGTAAEDNDRHQFSIAARAEALERFRKAKLAFHHACVGVLAGDRFAEEACDDALRELNAARAELARLGGRER